MALVSKFKLELKLNFFLSFLGFVVALCFLLDGAEQEELQEDK